MYLCPGGYIIISHPLGRKWLNETLHEQDPEMVPHPLPDQAQLEDLIFDLPLHLVKYVDEQQLYIATLQVSLLTQEADAVSAPAAHPFWVTMQTCLSFISTM